jgi:hypothetical protein
MVAILPVLAGGGCVFCYSNGDFLVGKPVEGLEVQGKLGKGGLMQEGLVQMGRNCRKI